MNTNPIADMKLMLLEASTRCFADGHIGLYLIIIDRVIGSPGLLFFRGLAAGSLRGFVPVDEEVFATIADKGSKKQHWGKEVQQVNR